MDKESLDVLKADDILSRVYVDQKDGALATLFVAYFSTQRTGRRHIRLKIASPEAAGCRRSQEKFPFPSKVRPALSRSTNT